MSTDDHGQVHAHHFATTPEWLLDADISSRAIHLWALLQRYAGAQGRAFPRRAVIAERLRCSPSSADRAIGELVAAGAVSVRPRFRLDRSQAANDYWLWPLLPPSGDDPDEHRRTGGASPVTRGGVTSDEPRTRASEREPENEVTPPSPPTPEPKLAASAPTVAPSAPSVVNTTPFAAFWAVYPRRVAKRAAQAAFERATKRAPVDEIVLGATRYAEDPNREPAFTAHPGPWLNGDRWEDDPLPSRVRIEPPVEPRAFESIRRVMAQREARGAGQDLPSDEGPLALVWSRGR